MRILQFHLLIFVGLFCLAFAGKCNFVLEQFLYNYDLWKDEKSILIIAYLSLWISCAAGQEMLSMGLLEHDFG